MTLTESDLFSFGALLKDFRTRRHLTQQQLAAAVGVHRHAIGRWEQGDFLPENKAMVLELAKHLHLDDQEACQLLEASLTALAPHWLVPLPRNPLFTGREEVLEALHTQLGVDRAVALTQSSALHGLGGVGKTQIALEYAYRHALEYSAVFWIGAETVEHAISSLLRIAEVLQLPGRNGKDQQHMVAAVQNWLSTHGQWLLIWDNLEDPAMLDRFLPSARSGSMLITTRCQALGTLAWGMDLLPMEQEEGMLFLLRRAKALSPAATWEQMRQFAVHAPTDSAAAREVVTALGGLPLALDQAGAYIEETGCSLADYFQRYEKQRAYLLDRRGGAGGNHPHSVITTFRLSSERVEREQRAAADLLRVCAFLQAEAIPEELFVAGAAHLGPELEALVADPAQFDQTIAVLRRLSLVQRQAETHTLSLHRLVQAMLRERMSEQEQAIWLKRVIAALNAMFPEVAPETWGQCKRLLPHVLTVATAIPDGAGDQELAEALRKAAMYLYDHAHYEQAERVYQRALYIREQVWGPEHPQVANALCGLGYLCYEQGQYQRAEPLFQRALRIREQALGLDHPDVASALHGLGLLCWKQGRYEQGERVYQRACSMLEQALGPGHPQVALLLNGLAILAFEQGKYEQAEPLYQRALRIREQQLGREHPRVASLLNNLAELYAKQGKYEQAEPLYQRALHIWEQALGPEHPDVAHPLQGLADLYAAQEKGKQAEPLYQHALFVREQALGAEHPDLASSLNGLAKLYLRQREYDQAERLYTRALSIQEQHLGQQHPETAQTLHDLALFHQKQGHLSEAIFLAERALKIRSLSLGEAHPETLATQTLSTQLVQEQAGAQEETASELRAEEIPESLRGERHTERAAPPLHEAISLSSSENDPLQGFLDACCELHPRAWCRISDLWQAYERWAGEHQEHFPLSRRAFAAQLKGRGCRTDRTNAARIWRGITLVTQEP